MKTWKIFSGSLLAFFYGALFVIPLISGVLQLSHLDQTVFTDPGALSALKFTLFQASLSVLLSMVIGFLLFVLSFERVPGWMRSWFVFPFILPTLLVVQIAVGFFGRSGFLGELGWIYRWEIVVFIHAWINAPWFFSLLHEARAQIAKQEVDAAAMCGATRMSRLFRIVFPQVYPAMIQGAVSIFSFTVMSYTIVMLLGGGPPVETLETQILFSIRGGELRMDQALACAFYQSLCTVASVMIGIALKNSQKVKWFKRGVSFDQDRSSPSILFIALFSLIWFLPVLLFFVSVSMKAVHVLNSEFLVIIATSLVQSLSVSAVVAVLSLLLAVCALYWSRGKNNLSSWLFLFFLLPPSFSSLTLGVLAWQTWAPVLSPLDYGIFYLIVFQIVLNAPIGVRMLKESIDSSDRSTYDAARIFGASPMRAFWVAEVPRLTPIAVQFLGISFAFSLGELALLHLFQPLDWEPLPSMIARLHSQYRYDEASVVVLVVALSVFFGLGFTKILSRKFIGLS